MLIALHMRRQNHPAGQPLNKGMVNARNISCHVENTIVPVESKNVKIRLKLHYSPCKQAGYMKYETRKQE